jgi:hypothetical protein
MHLLKGLFFLTKCWCYIAWRVIRCAEWNMMTVTLENPDGTRRNIRYMRASGSYDLHDYTYDYKDFLGDLTK